MFLTGLPGLVGRQRQDAAVGRWTSVTSRVAVSITGLSVPRRVGRAGSDTSYRSTPRRPWPLQLSSATASRSPVNVFVAASGLTVIAETARATVAPGASPAEVTSIVLTTAPRGRRNRANLRTGALASQVEHV